jgi:glycerophosphoryl diester phosphodiesterase
VRGDYKVNFHFVFQVTKDGCPVIFHDNFIFTEQDVRSELPMNVSLRRQYGAMTHKTMTNLFQGEISGKRVTDLGLDEFLSYGPQKDQGKVRTHNSRKLLPYI